jgi:WD40 repeat protein
MNSAVFSPDGSLLATGGREKDVMLWDVESGELLGEFSSHYHYILRMAFNPQGTMLASAIWDNFVKLWAIGEGD